MKTNNIYTSDILTNTNSVIKVPRTTFREPSKLQTAFNGGKLIPLKVYECYPGDTLKVDLASLVRVNSPFVKAPMGEIEYSAYAFKVPMRILLDDFEEIIANYNPLPDWTTDNTNLIPGIEIPSANGFAVGSVADYLGFPVNVGSSSSSLTKLNALPLRAYVMIGDQWFRDEDLMNTAGVNRANVDVVGVDNIAGDYLTDAVLGGALYPVCKLKSGDPFSTCRPGIQKGAPVTINVGGTAPIVWNNVLFKVGAGATKNSDPSQVYNFSPVFSYGRNASNYPFFQFNVDDGLNADIGLARFGSSSQSSSGFQTAQIQNSDFTGGTINNYLYADPNQIVANGTGQYTNAGYVDLSNATAIAISDLRLKFQLEKIKELDALYGNRYPEYLRGRWGVRCADGRLQIPEYLGSQKFLLNINQTVQTSASSAGSTAQSNISAYSLSHKNGYMFETSCTEHCYIMIVGTCRIKHREYAQGVPEWALHRSREDFYVPELANISAQPVKNAEIYYGGTTYDNQNFGYKEAWWWMRMEKNICTGLMRPNVSGSLAIWNLADNYNSLPTLSASWIIEDMSALDRALAIPGATTPHFIANLVFNSVFTRPIPLHSYPGLVDHQWGYRS